MESFSSEKQNSESLADIAKTTIEELVQTIPAELMNTSMKLVDSLKPDGDKTQLQGLWAEWVNQTEVYTDSIDNSKLRSEAQVAALINKAFIFQLAGNSVRYLEELDDAEVYAANEGLETVANSLDIEIKSGVESLELSPEKVVLKLRGVIDDANREYLKELVRDEADLEEIIGAAYGMILDEGGNPGIVLAGLGITE